MAGTKISDLTPFADGTDVSSADVMPVVDQSASETKKLSVGLLAAALPALFPDGSISAEKIESTLADGSVTTVKLANGAVTAAKLADNSTLLVGQGAPSSNGSYTGQQYFDVTNRVLYRYDAQTATWSVMLTQDVEDKSITGVKLADSSTAIVSNSQPSGSGDYVGQLWINAATEAIYVWDGNSWIVGIDSILADKVVTNVKLADNSTTVSAAGLLPDGVFIGQLGYDTVTGKLYVWSGVEWQDTRASLSVNEINYGAGIVALFITQDEDVVTIDTAMVDTTGPAEVLAGPTESGGVVGYRQLVGEDLPVASETSRGAVRVGGEGLRMDGDQIEIDNDIVPVVDTFFLCELNEKGLVINFRAIQPTDLPIATDTSVGVIKPGPDFEVDADGILGLETKITPGIYTKVGVEATGLVSSGATLEEDDIPDLDTSKIVTGTFDPSLIADNSISGLKLEDYSTCLMQEDFPGPGDFLGQFWYTPSTAQLRVYARGSGPENIWLPVGFGVLAQQNLRVGFTYDAATAKIITTTSYGTNAGLAPNQSIPNPTDELIGIYGICVTPGNAITVPNLSGTIHTAGDWILCLGETEGWVHIDVTSGGGGGGGGAQVLNDLLDVTLNDGTIDTIDLDPIPAVALQDGQLLKYRASDGQWRNSNIIDCGSY